MEISFEGKTVLVTGAGQGIGRAIAIALAKCKAKVVAISKTPDYLNTLVKDHPEIRTLQVDLADWDQTKKAMQQIGPIDALVNNAAVAILEPFLQVESKSFDSSFAVNVKAVINVSQEVAKGMIERGKGGAIVNISSQASMAGLQDHAVYCATKGALDALTRVMAVELGPKNIRVNCVNPTVIMTEMGKIGWADPAKSGPMRAKIPLGRFGEVEEVVNTVLFLLSDKASMINGVTLPIDGGFLAA